MREAFYLSFALTLAAFGATAARAGQFKDCPLLGIMPGYEAQDNPDLRRWDGASFTIKDGDGEKDVTIKGPVCLQNYGEKPGKTDGSILEYIENYKSEFQRLGGEIKNAKDGYIAGVVKDHGNDIWIRVWGTRDDGYTIQEVTQAPLTPTLLAPGGNDYRLIGHMPGFKAEPPEKKNFVEHSFPTANGDLAVRGRLYQVHYDEPDSKPNIPRITREEVLGNYRVALHALGAESLRDDGFGAENITYRFDDHGQLIYIYIDGDNVTALEEKPFQLTIKPPTADAMKDALDHDGHIALYVNFDFARATLKPDAAPIIAEVVSLLKRNPELKISIDGHTDSVGGHDYNIKLSQDRAAAVVAAVVAAGVPGSRLQSNGYGPDKPIASNDTDEGRAKNRRVELVKAP